MAYNTKPIVTDKDGNPISQYYNKELDQFEPVEGQAGANKVVLYNKDGTENNNLSLIPILDKLSQLTGTVIDEETRKSNELQRIELYNQISNMLETGQLKGEKGDKGDTGIGLNFLWQGTSLGVKLETDAEYVFVDLRGPQGPAGDIDNLTSQHIEDALGYTPVKSVNNVVADEIGNVELDIDTSAIENRIDDLEDNLAEHKAENIQQFQEIYSKLGGLQGNDIQARREILDIKLKLDEMKVIDYLNKTGIGFYDLFENTEYIDISNTTAIVDTTSADVVFTGQESLKMLPQKFDESINNIELAIYDIDRESYQVDNSVSNSTQIQITIQPGKISIGDKYYYNGEVYEVTGVSEV